MRPSSAKAKGRRLQQETRDSLLKYAPSLEEDDVRSTSMGASGEDILFSPAARKIYPFSIECKNVEKLSIWGAIDQAIDNKGKHDEMVVFAKNQSETYVALKFETFLEMVYGKQDNDVDCDDSNWICIGESYVPEDN